MDIFKIDQALSGNLGRAPSPDKISATELTFETGSEFNLCFFDTTEDTQGFSDPSSVGSTTDGSPPPQQLTPLHISLGGSTPIQSPGLLSPPGVPTSSITIKQEHYVAADSNSSSTTKSFVPCKVCGDKASGYHYGVTSCEGCKGFFRRSIQKQIEYRCLRDGKCLVIRLNRNRCQYCRFKKCLSVGMSRDSVRYGRVPKRSRERSADVSTSEGEQFDAESKKMYDFITGIFQAHQQNSGYTEEYTKLLVRNPIVIPPASPQIDNGVASSTVETLEQEKCWLLKQFSTRVTPSVQRIVEFAKRVSGFSELSQDDQLILIKIGFFEIWLCHVMKLTTNTSMMFNDGVSFSKQQLEIMYDEDFASSFMNLASSFNAFSLNDIELALFSAVVLMTADRPGITDVKSIEQHKDKIVEALKFQLGRSHNSDPQMFSNLMTKVAEIRSLGAKQTALLDWYRAHWRKLSLPPLFAEIFDIPKIDENMQ